MKSRPALIVVALILCLVLLRPEGAQDSSPGMGLRPPPLLGRVIVIDPGHGGIDDGASHPAFPMPEKDLNLDIALRLSALLAGLGAVPVLTREIDEMRGGSYLADLTLRVEDANRSGGHLLISVHANTFPDPSCSGGQAFFQMACAESRRLAELVQEELVLIQPDNDRAPQPVDYFVLTATDMPAVLVEVGFLTSPADRRLLADEAYRNQMARALVRAVIRYLNGP